MDNFEQLLIDLEAKRDMAYMEAKDQHMKADTLNYVAAMLRNAISKEKKEREAKEA